MEDAMNADENPDVKHDRYMELLREWFSCKCAKLTLDFWMHRNFWKYIKLHNAIMKGYVWNAHVLSTRAHLYGYGAISVITQSHLVKNKRVDNYPKLYCSQSTATELFRGPPHILNINLPAILDFDNINTNITNTQSTVNNHNQSRKRKRNDLDFDDTMKSCIDGKWQYENNSDDDSWKSLFQESKRRRVAGLRLFNVSYHSFFFFCFFLRFKVCMYLIPYTKEHTIHRCARIFFA